MRWTSAIVFLFFKADLFLEPCIHSNRLSHMSLLKDAELHARQGAGFVQVYTHFLFHRLYLFHKQPTCLYSSKNQRHLVSRDCRRNIKLRVLLRQMYFYFIKCGRGRGRDPSCITETQKGVSQSLGHRSGVNYYNDSLTVC